MNLWKEDKEGGYAVQHGWRPASDFRSRDHPGSNENFWEKAYPTLFPYGEGGPERMRMVELSLSEHIRWLMDYHDRRFRLHPEFIFTAYSVQQRRQALASARVQAKRHDFERERVLLSTITKEQLQQAAKDEEKNIPSTNPAIIALKRHVHGTARRVVGADASRLQLRPLIWSTSFAFGPANVWLTINPDDMHDPVAQFFVGNEVNMDAFATLTESESTGNTWSKNIARDGYGAATYFEFIIRTVFETLFGIRATANRVFTQKGVYGYVRAYIGAVETQGRGTLHFHTLLWLQGSPSASQWKDALSNASFREKLSSFIRANCRSFVPGLEDEEQIRAVDPKANIAHRRPPAPSAPEYWSDVQALEKIVVRTKQIHVCTDTTCLKVDRYGRIRCKRGAPWPLSQTDIVNADGEWNPKRTYGYINPYNPHISVNLRCNNDNKVLTNAARTEGLTYYFTTYGTKKQGRSYNLSSLLAKSHAYHLQNDPYVNNLHESNRLLLFRCVNVLNKQQEIAEPLVGLFARGQSESFKSHHYPTLSWTSFHYALKREFSFEPTAK